MKFRFLAEIIYYFSFGFASDGVWPEIKNIYVTAENHQEALEKALEKAQKLNEYHCESCARPIQAKVFLPKRYKKYTGLEQDFVEISAYPANKLNE